MARVLTKIRIDEVSAVPAGEGVRVLLMKRAPADDVEEARRASYEKFLKIFTKAEADDGGNDAGGGDITDHPVVQAARLLVASGKFGDHGQALDYLLNKPAGQALLTRLKAADQPAKDPPMDSIHAIMKAAGIAATCAQMVQKGSTSISEEAIVSAVGKIAAERWPELSEAQAFSRIYTASTDEARVLQKAIAIAKLSPFDIRPTMVGGVDATHEANDSEQSEASRQLGEMAERLRATSPQLSADQAFARVFENPKNAVLAAKMHRRPSATTVYEFPR